MAGIYKYGWPTSKDRDEAKVETLAAIRAGGDDDPILEDASIIETDEHKAAGEYLVRIVTGQPAPEPVAGQGGGGEMWPDLQEQLQARREQLLAELAEIDAQIPAES